MKLIIEMLKLGDLYGVSREVDIAKGYNKLPQTVKEALIQRKRKAQWQ